MDIKGVIKSKGFTIKDVAEKIGVNRVTLTVTIQNGNPTYQKLKQIALAIGCDVADFFEDEKEAAQTASPALCCPYCGKPLQVAIECKE